MSNTEDWHHCPVSAESKETPNNWALEEEAMATLRFEDSCVNAP